MWLKLIGWGLGLALALHWGYGAASGLNPAVQAALEKAGWAVESGADGSLILRPKPESTPPSVAAEEKEPEDVEADRWAQLRDAGWRVEKGADGSTLLYPPAQPTLPAAPNTESPPQTAPNLDQLMAERGWLVERLADGSVILRPRAAEAPRAKVVPAKGYVPSAVRNADVSTPVDEWGEAKRIASDWLKVFGNNTMSVGRIRKVLRVYVVSIVDKKPPYRLEHQLAINAADGRVIVLN